MLVMKSSYTILSREGTPGKKNMIMFFPTAKKEHDHSVSQTLPEKMNECIQYVL